MYSMKNKTTHLLIALILGFLSITGANPAFARDADNEEASGPSMVLDALVVRPMGIAGTILGTVFFIGSLPFTILGGNVPEAAEALVIKPARYTFVRPLGGE